MANNAPRGDYVSRVLSRAAAMTRSDFGLEDAASVCETDLDRCNAVVLWGPPEPSQLVWDIGKYGAGMADLLFIAAVFFF